jgi:hypothetical protein
MKRIAFFAILFMALAATPQGQDPQEGARWANDVCGECHAVRTGQVRSPNGRAPTFVELANIPGMTTPNRCAYHALRWNADVRPHLRAAARHHCLHSEPEGQ